MENFRIVSLSLFFLYQLNIIDGQIAKEFDYHRRDFRCVKTGDDEDDLKTCHAHSSSVYPNPWKMQNYDEFWGANYAVDGYNSIFGYKVFHSGYELFPYLYIEFSEPIKTQISVVEICNICSSNGWYDSMNLNVMMKKAMISSLPGHIIKDGTMCGKLEAPAGSYDSCDCTNVTCDNPMSNVKSVTIQRIKYDRNGIFDSRFLNEQLLSMQSKYAKPIRTFLVIKEVRFH